MGLRPPYETFVHPTCKGCYAFGTACGSCEKCAWERQHMGENGVIIASKDDPVLKALAEVMKEAVPGLKMPHAALAAAIQRMLFKRGVQLTVIDRP